MDLILLDGYQTNNPPGNKLALLREAQENITHRVNPYKRNSLRVNT